MFSPRWLKNICVYFLCAHYGFRHASSSIDVANGEDRADGSECSADEAGRESDD